jgi:protein-S-isoprenylcysteine O-methyltransferase Ste14
VGGIILLGLAGLLAAGGLWSIGRQMSSQAEVRPDTELVTDGAFRVVRHPLYLSILLLWAGGTLALASWFMAVCTVALVPLFVARSRLEERILVRHFGDAYRAYMRDVPMLLPGWPHHRPGTA